MDAFVLGFIFAAPVFLIVGYCCGLYDGTKGWAAPYRVVITATPGGKKGCNG